MQQPSTEVVPPQEDPLSREIELPLGTPVCGECLFQGACPCSSKKTVGTRTIEHRLQLLPLFNAAASAGGKKAVRAHANVFDSGDLKEVLGAGAYGLPNVEVAACVDKRNEEAIMNGVRAVLHNKQSTENHKARKIGHKPAPAPVGRMPKPEEIPSFLEEMPQPPQTTWQKLVALFG